MPDLLDNLEKDSLMNGILSCVAREQIDVSAPENHYLLFCLNGPAQVLYEDHAATEPGIVQKIADRRPCVAGAPNFAEHPTFEYGAIFDAVANEILAYRLRSL